MRRFPSLPEEIVAVFGPISSKKFVDYLHETLTLEREDTISMFSMSFENRLVSEVGLINLTIAELKTEMAEVRTEIAEVRSEIAEIRSDLKEDIAILHKEISDVHKENSRIHKEISGIHKEISTQTRLILAGLALTATLYPIISRLMIRLIP